MNKEQRDLIAESYYGLVEEIVNGVIAKNWKYRGMREDFTSLGNELLLKMASKCVNIKNFKRDFSVRFRSRIKDLVAREIQYRKRVSSYSEDNIDLLDIDKEFYEEDNLIDTGLLERLEGKLTGDEVDIVNMHFTGTLSNREMAEHLGLKDIKSFWKKKQYLKRKIRRLIENGDC